MMTRPMFIYASDNDHDDDDELYAEAKRSRYINNTTSNNKKYIK